MLVRLVPVLVALMLAGCNAPPAADRALLGEILDRIKDEIGAYQQASAADLERRRAAFRAGGRGTCAEADPIVFDIEEIVVEIATSRTTDANASVGAGDIPAGAATVGGSLGFGTSHVATEKLVFRFFPLPVDQAPRQSANGQLGAIGGALVTLRDALITASAEPPCFALGIRDRPTEANRFEFGLSVKTDNSGKVTIGIAPITITAGGGVTSVTGHTIRVTFRPRDWQAGRATRPGARRLPQQSPGSGSGYGTFGEDQAIGVRLR